MTTLILFAWVGGFVGGLVVGSSIVVRRDRDPDWRRSFTHENSKRPSGPPPLKLRRSGDDYQPGRRFNNQNTAPDSSPNRPFSKP